MHYDMNLRHVSPKNFYPLSRDFSGKTPKGEHLSFTNYYMEINHIPYFGISGEIHFSRLSAHRWEDAILKMKAGGIRIISSYVFWNHHEEEEGIFDFSGQRNLRHFVELCRQHGMYVIIRIGPFNHGEVRNGGLPDWLYGKPFEVRSLNKEFLHCTRLLYRHIALELKGLYYEDGGPVIAAQIDNEYMHSAAPWEMTTGVSNEWLPAGEQGDAYMLCLQNIAQEEGIRVPFYTCTGWGGASTPKELMPLWGGYAFRPWIFYSHKGEHPATEEYIYRDNHNNKVPATYNFEPFYEPESKPYLCCEMGGGMTCCYYYRFQLDFQSVDAMANIKLGSGCNMLGYYMYHGGTNPKTKKGVFLNEGQVPKLSYDYQAAIGEFGQLRESYRRLRVLHLFVKSFEKELYRMKTVLPEDSQTLVPEDNLTLRYAVRLNEKGEGFLFLNNYQDHSQMLPKKNEVVRLHLHNEDIVMDGISLDAGENCILPFHLNIGGLQLRSALVQPLTITELHGKTYAFFFVPSGMDAQYTFPAETEVYAEAEGLRIVKRDFLQVNLSKELPVFTAAQQGREVVFVTLNREQSLQFQLLTYHEKTVALISDATVMISNDGMKIEHESNHASVSVFPDGVLPLHSFTGKDGKGLFTEYQLQCEAVLLDIEFQKIGPTRYTITVPEWDDESVKEMLLQIQYQGDIGSAYINGEMISDNFCNGAVWEISLKEFYKQLRERPLTIYITPLKEESNVNVQSVMAGRHEELEGIIGEIQSVSTKAIYEWRI